MSANTAADGGIRRLGRFPFAVSFFLQAHIVLSAALLFPTGAIARPHFSDMLDPIVHDPGCKLNDQPDFSLFTCGGGLTLWYFTKPNHPAHPGIIKRVVVRGAAGWSVHEEATSFAPDDRQAPFLAWLEQIKRLDAQMEASINRSNGNVR